MAVADRLAQGLVWAAWHSILGRGKMRSGVLSLLTKGLGRRHLDTRIWGAPLRLHLDNTCEAKFLLAPSRYNRDEFDFIERHMPRRGGVFVDVGANAGVFAFRAATHAEDACRVVCIEPNPAMVTRMRTDVLGPGRFPADRVDIRFETCAVSDEDGQGWLDLTSGLGTAHLSNAAGASQNDGDGLKVPLRRLDTVLRDAGLTRVDVLKIDVEGHEDKALVPLMSEENKDLWPKAMILEHCEQDHWRLDLMDRLTALGYRETDRTRNNSLLVLGGE